MSLTPDQRQQARLIIRRYLEKAEGNQPDIHYSQARPLTSLGKPPDSIFWTDCSGLVISAFYWAELWSAFKVIDPSGFAFAGWGFTGTLLSTNRRRRVPLDHKFFVGDIALYGRSLTSTSHTTICRRNGDYMSSVWTSHGSERGPYPTRLNYRSDLLVVVRGESLA